MTYIRAAELFRIFQQFIVPLPRAEELLRFPFFL
jgi:hypothetical protein